MSHLPYPGSPATQDMYGRRVQRYVEKLVAKTKPKRVVINMLYFLDETSGRSSETDRPTDRPTNRPRPTDRNQPTNQPTNHPTNQPTNHPTC